MFPWVSVEKLDGSSFLVVDIMSVGVGFWHRWDVKCMSLKEGDFHVLTLLSSEVRG